MYLPADVDTNNSVPAVVDATVPSTVVENLVQDTDVENPVQNIVAADQIQGDGGVVENGANVVGEEVEIQNIVQPRGGGDRYPQRVRRPPAHLNDYEVNISDEHVDQIHANIDYCYSASSVQIPNSYNAAMKSPEAENWKQAMDAEMRALSDSKTYTLVELPPGKSTVSGRWVYCINPS